ncbi:Dynein regulatory complex protein 11 [Manis javanica]|nr:Dynein regulatory complex protein 11 [Manis javanica]
MCRAICAQVAIAQAERADPQAARILGGTQGDPARMPSMPPTPTLVQPLPLDADGILALAARSMFQLFSTMSQGMFLADRAGRIVWANEGYQRFLPDPRGLGGRLLGHMVEDVIPNTRMRRVLETGEPVLIDLLTNRAGTFVVSRIPLKDDAGAVIGAIGIVPSTSRRPRCSPHQQVRRSGSATWTRPGELAAQRNRSLRVAAGRAPRQAARFASLSAAARRPWRSSARHAARPSRSALAVAGRTGTGKELLAHAIHAASARTGGPSSPSTSPPYRMPCWRPSSSALPWRLAPVQTVAARRHPGWPTAARSSSTKSATCP